MINKVLGENPDGVYLNAPKCSFLFVRRIIFVTVDFIHFPQESDVSTHVTTVVVTGNGFHSLSTVTAGY